ncbi:MAG: hypothetical protein ACE5J4_00010 [Candidatus Aenigmatarchaeota archaeon]
MLTNKEKKQFLMIALSCLRKKGEARPIFSPDVPTKDELDSIREGLKNGNIGEDLLKKFFPIAYKGVLKHGIMKYFFLIHNKMIMNLDRYTKTNLVEWCRAYPSKIIGKKNSKWVVERIDGKKIISDTNIYPGLKLNDKDLRIGSLVILHRGKIHMVLNEKQYKEAVEFFNLLKS